LYRLYRLLLIALLSLTALPAFGQYTRDTAAKKKIDEAINKYYVETDFEKAEGVLLGTINACGDKCSPQVHASAWMYVGIVRGSGKNNQAGAKEAFQKAVAADPNIKLDMVLATPETQATFAAVAGGGAAAAPVEAPPAAAAAGEEGGAGALACSPEVRDVETRRAIPIQCQSDEEVTSMEVKYKPFGSDTWKTLPMAKKGAAFRATIPCDGTGIAGTLRVYVRAKDPQGEQVDSWGSKQAPIEFNLAEGVEAEPPAFEGEAPPARCADKGECPPDFPGCESKSSDGCEGRGQKDWGAACDNSVDCKCGLLCTDGTCETAPSCETNADCSTGICKGGKCDIEGGDDGGFGPREPYKKNWFGIHFGQDLAFVGGNNVCDATLGQADANYACFYEGTDNQPFFRTPFPYRDGIKNGMVLATSRIMLSYERAFTSRITLGGRLGYAFGGGPPAGQTSDVPAQAPMNGFPEDRPYQVPFKATANGGTPFLPVHFEVRGAFWFLPLTNKLFRAYGALGGGMAQVDAKVSIPELDCNDAGVKYANPGDTDPLAPLPDGSPSQGSVYVDPETGQRYSQFGQCQVGPPIGYYDYTKYPTYNVDGWKKMGQGFVTAGLGGMIAFKDNMGVLLNVNFMYMLPASGFVIEPSLGFTLGM
jgi:hypothetical protein